MASERRQIPIDGSWTTLNNASIVGNEILLSYVEGSGVMPVAFQGGSLASYGFTLPGPYSGLQLEFEVWLDTTEPPAFYPIGYMYLLDNTYNNTLISTTLDANITIGVPDYKANDTGIVPQSPAFDGSLGVFFQCGQSNFNFGTFHVRNLYLTLHTTEGGIKTRAWGD